MSSKKDRKRAPKPKKITKVDLAKAEKPIAEYNKSLPVALGPQEKDDLGREAGKLALKIEALKNQKRADNEKTNAEIKKEDARLKILHGCLATGTEDREIKVVVIPDRSNRRKFVVRKDTGQVLEESKMTAEEIGGGGAGADTPTASTAEKSETKPKGRKLNRPKKGAETPTADEAPSGDDGDGSDDAGEPGDDGE